MRIYCSVFILFIFKLKDDLNDFQISNSGNVLLAYAFKSLKMFDISELPTKLH